MTQGRKRLARVLSTVCITAVGGSMLIAGPSQAAPDSPDIDIVQARVDHLYRQAEQASERYNDARLQLRRASSQLDALHSDLRRERLQVESLRGQLASSVIADYQGSALASTTQVLLADNPDSFLDGLTAMSQMDDQKSQMMSSYAADTGQLETREADARRELVGIANTKKQLGTEKADVDHKAAQAKALLRHLKARAAARAASRSASRSASRPAGQSTTAVSAPASGRAAAAVRYALAQVGHAYVYGAAGPSAFDCSGLTMRAWGQAGVSLPHSSSAQTGSGTRISQSQLQPGDLVFYYSPVSHVGMYIGNGQIVNAENPSVGIKITGVNSMPYAGAVRPR